MKVPDCDCIKKIYGNQPYPLNIYPFYHVGEYWRESKQRYDTMYLEPHFCPQCGKAYKEKK